MRPTTRILASTLAVAALGVAGAQSVATATAWTDTCQHASVTPSSGHNNGVEFISHWTIEGDHTHKYRHNQTIFASHKNERDCTGHPA